MSVSAPLTAGESIGTFSSAKSRCVKSKTDLNAKKEFLLKYSSNECEITRLENEIAVWESRSEKVTACFDGMGVNEGRGDDRIQYAVDMLCELRGALYERLLDSTALRLEIESCISAVKDDRLRLILEYRYIDRLTWETISQLLNTEYRWVLRLHNRALDLVEIKSI